MMDTNMRMLIRYYYRDNDVWALWENMDGSRWREHIVVDGVVQW